MAEFDYELWRFRAEVRRDKLAEEHPKRASFQYSEDLLAIVGIQKVVSWCKKKGVQVTFTTASNGTWFPSEKKIELNSLTLPKRQLCNLLHECGHFLAEAKQAKRAKAEKKRDKKSNVQRVVVVEEEFDAWGEGAKLAKRLKVYIDQKLWNQHRANCLTSYFRWVMS